MDVFSPTPRNWRELERPGDVFSLALEMQTASKSGDVFSPASKNTRSGIENKEIGEREPATRLDRSFLLGERNESN